MIPDAMRLARLDEYVKNSVAAYRSAGRSQQEMDDLEKFLRAEHIPEWMEFEEAQLIIMQLALTDSRGRFSDDEVANANRTSVTATLHEKAALISERLGIGYAEAKRAAAGVPLESDVDDADSLNALYRHYDADDVLLYVGISHSPTERTAQHRANSAWSTFAVRNDIEWFANRAEVVAAEKAAIKSESPVFNKTHNGPDRDERVIKYLVDHAAIDFLAPTI